MVAFLLSVVAASFIYSGDRAKLPVRLDVEEAPCKKDTEISWTWETQLTANTFKIMHGCMYRDKYEKCCWEQASWWIRFYDNLIRYVPTFKNTNQKQTLNTKQSNEGWMISGEYRFNGADHAFNNLKEVGVKIAWREGDPSQPDDSEKDDKSEVLVGFWYYQADNMHVVTDRVLRISSELICDAIIKIKETKTTALENKDLFELFRKDISANYKQVSHEYKGWTYINIHNWKKDQFGNLIYGALFHQITEKDDFTENGCKDNLYNIDIEIGPIGKKRHAITEFTLAYKYPILVVVFAIIAANGCGILTCERLRDCSRATSETSSIKKDN